MINGFGMIQCINFCFHFVIGIKKNFLKEQNRYKGNVDCKHVYVQTTNKNQKLCICFPFKTEIISNFLFCFYFLQMVFFLLMNKLHFILEKFQFVFLLLFYQISFFYFIVMKINCWVAAFRLSARIHILQWYKLLSKQTFPKSFSWLEKQHVAIQSLETFKRRVFFWMHRMF